MRAVKPATGAALSRVFREELLFLLRTYTTRIEASLQEAPTTPSSGGNTAVEVEGRGPGNGRGEGGAAGTSLPVARGASRSP